MKYSISYGREKQNCRKQTLLESLPLELLKLQEQKNTNNDTAIVHCS